MPQTDLVARRATSFQDLASAHPMGRSQMVQSWIMSVGTELSEAPGWWGKSRDDWLTRYWKQPGNDLLAGALSTLVAKVAATDWYIEGPIELAKMYRHILLHNADFGNGWDTFVSKWVTGYLSRDMGGLCERLRSSAGDRTGPALGFNHLDESKCYMTGDPEYPIMYIGDRERKIPRSSMLRIVDMPSGRDTDLGYGFCGVSRALATAAILRDVVRYKRERLSDLPPAGIMFINNMSETQWKDVIKKYNAKQHNEGNTTWQDIMVAFGYDPEFPVSADLFELSSLPEHYDEETATNIAIYTFALAFRVDPREYWPVSAGPLGTATEAEIQHQKAKAKGEGIIFSAIEHALNDPQSLPESLTFKFDYRDDEEDMMAAKIDNQRISNIRKMWEPSSATGGGRPRLDQEAEDVQSLGAPMEGMITTEQARMLLAREGLIPAEFVPGLIVEEERVYDTRTWGPYGRVTREGKAIRAL